ncbi:hypothetical protein DRW03_30985 [Corallococcus sp. H22C18031201]|uniref:muconolactone Delta-isomerase family protein n=1 Tax=Citreicoccus inhibens TaxID=2849499 RepID=UPI000E746D6C|nr:muconolactone Delta-isomerase family protein [Citreicoccus inhibens]MBJ6763925.1 hypothetical protein [Myxococcaceae bacterium JPH2]MBU8900197.1 muconolactone Delta-isomerase family protein [Citreicoccus inhibens]RJS16365.1 hypothetical protein DRW03_30985 [Corallococcus sp. H22C18031201]
MVESRSATQDMLYLVTWEFIESAAPASAEKAMRMLRDSVLPGLRKCAEWEQQGRILGGGSVVGEKASVVVMRAASNEELSRMLRSLPFWGLMRMKVTPLEGFAERAAQEEKSVARLEELHKQGLLT